MLTTTDKERILRGKKLNDLHINLDVKTAVLRISRPEIQTRKHPGEEKE